MNIDLPDWLTVLIVIGLVISAINHVVNIANLFRKSKEHQEEKSNEQ